MLKEVTADTPVQARHVNQTIQFVIASNIQSYSRYGGGAKERALENIKIGVASQLDMDLTNGLACAWCAAYLPRRFKAEGVDSTYCSMKCAEEGRLKRGGKYASTNIRQQLFALEKGVCRRCNIDAHALYIRIRALKPIERLNALINANFTLPKSDRLLTSPTEGDFWQVRNNSAVCGILPALLPTFT